MFEGLSHLLDSDISDHEKHVLRVLSVIFGWVYFVAWSISFYPQLILNYRRKSVVGLSFDFLVLNITGFFCYTLYNFMFFFDSEIKKEYQEDHPSATGIPVEPNDLAFAMHALVISVLTGVQCFMYDRGGQKVSKLCWVLTHECWVWIVVCLALAGAGKVTWYSGITWMSYVKLFVSFCKYIPQAIMNFRRKCTVGWSIHNVLLDFTGGTFSFAQLFVDAVRKGSWRNFTGNPAKLGLSLLSIAFDILFIVQHYVLYRNNRPPEDEVNVELDKEGNVVEHVNGGSHSVNCESTPLLGSKGEDDDVLP